jgi:hypothetical protein
MDLMDCFMVCPRLGAGWSAVKDLDRRGGLHLFDRLLTLFFGPISVPKPDLFLQR